MTLDKFNRHLYQHDASEILIVEGLSKVTCESMFYIGGVSTSSAGYVHILNSEIHGGRPTYIVPLTRATIKSVSYTPSDVKIYVNDKQYDDNSLVGLELCKDDRIALQHKPNSKNLFCFSAVISTKVVPDRK